MLLTTYQYLTRPKIVAVHKQKAVVIPRPDDLTLVDLPEDALLLVQLLPSQSFALPVYPVPVFISIANSCVFGAGSCEIYPGIVFRMAVSIDIRPSFQSTDVAVPGLYLTVPPESFVSSCHGHWNTITTFERDISNASTNEMVHVVWSMVEEEEDNT